jgi:predicted nucleotidyltransferase component of viral defense system
MHEQTYQNRIYPFQDEILKLLERLNLDFYLTGGTALSRCYLEHRYSDDLDFFVNDHHTFRDQCQKAISSFKNQWKCEITVTADSFVRLFIEEERALKICFPLSF